MTANVERPFDAAVDNDAPIAGESLTHILAAGAGKSPQLRTLCAIMAASRQPMFVLWGRRQQLLYNDAYGAILGERHPSSFGRPFLRVWSEIVDALEPLVARAYGGESIHMDDIVLAMVRHGVQQDAHFSFSYTPIYGDTADQVLGVFCVCAETTDLVLQEKSRKEDEARRLRLFDNAPGFMAMMSGPEHVFEFANKGFDRAAGGRELIGRTVREAFPEIEQQGLIALLNGVYTTGKRYLAQGLTLQLRAHPDQPEEAHVLDFVYEPITDGEGAVTGIFVAGFDTTEAVEAQRAARESHARRKEVLDSMGEGFVVLDTDYRVIEINAEGVRLDGRTEAEIVGRSHWELWPASIGTPVEASYRRVMTDRVPMHFQHHYVGEGHDISVEVRAYPVNGGIAAFYRDVTAIARAQTELRHSHDRFRAATEAVGVMWTNSFDGFMSGEQPGWATLTGQTEAEYRGFGWAGALHPDDAQPTIDAWNQAVAERRLFTFEHRVRRRDGAWRRFAIRAVPVIGKEGSLREWVGVHVDITDAALAAEALRAADRRKDEFLATLAHELRNPLAATRAAVELLARPELPRDRVVWASGVIARQSRAMSALLDELLDLSRFRSGSVALRPEPVELATLVESAVETVSHLLDTKRHHLSVRLPDAPLLLQVDRLRTSQVLINLLTNAAKYTDPGGQLQVVAATTPGFVCIDVIDNGVGLAADSLVAVFGMFSQVRGESDRSDGGLGIGLTLAQRLVELQGGHIEVFSDGLGCGSTFRVFLPFADPSGQVSARQSEADI